MKVEKVKPVPAMLRLKPALLKKVDRAAEQNNRSRNAEAAFRLEQSFKKTAATQ